MNMPRQPSIRSHHTNHPYHVSGQVAYSPGSVHPQPSAGPISMSVHQMHPPQPYLANAVNHQSNHSHQQNYQQHSPTNSSGHTSPHTSPQAPTQPLTRADMHPQSQVHPQAHGHSNHASPPMSSLNHTPPAPQAVHHQKQSLQAQQTTVNGSSTHTPNASPTATVSGGSHPQTQQQNGQAAGSAGPVAPVLNSSTALKKKHVCQTCARAFTTSGHLARHARVHTGERNHKCPFPGCETRCSRQDNLQQQYVIFAFQAPKKRLF